MLVQASGLAWAGWAGIQGGGWLNAGSAGFGVGGFGVGGAHGAWAGDAGLAGLGLSGPGVAGLGLAGLGGAAGAGLDAAGLSALGFAFMLIMCRCGAAVMLLPALGEEDPPTILRASLALCLTVLLVPILGPSMPPPPESFLRLAGMVAAELMAGGVLGWLARVLALALPGTGQLISLLIGQSSVLLPDATFGVQSAAVGRLFRLAAPVLILSTGLYALPLGALANSYTVFPPGGVGVGTGGVMAGGGGMMPAGDMAEVAVRAVSASFALSLRLASPFILISLVWQVSLGLLARLVPQIQVYFASLPGQVFGGLLLLALLTAPILRAWLAAMHEGFAGLPGG